ncbi:DUF1223 domain-containing protein [Phenylobacterium sp.]|uniref:DUF1223 domain-containing protein n=1 Tax=Phenylobacterium sp. TaxID=1871053 RepID=UPI002FE2DFA8
MRIAALVALSLLALPVAASARPPVVVELFTAQGCASCGEANAFVARLAERPGVLALTFPVDYWDYLGWEDTFAEPEFAERQKAYVAKLKLREPYTPQVVIDGRDQAAGLRTERVEQLLREAARAPRDPPDIQFMSPRRVDVGSGRVPRGGAEVWLIRYDPREQEVAVKSGDNRGQTITHRNVVREIHRLGAWRGRPTAYRIPATEDDGLATALVVQAAKGGRIVAVAQPKA